MKNAKIRRVKLWFSSTLFIVLFSVSSLLAVNSPERLIVRFTDESIKFPSGAENQCFAPSSTSISIDDGVKNVLNKHGATNICKADPGIAKGDSLYVTAGNDTVYIPYLYYRFLIDFPNANARDSAITGLDTLGVTLYAHDVKEDTICGSETSDTWFFDSWYLRNVWDNDLDCDEAWQLLRGQYPCKSSEQMGHILC